MVSMVGGDAIFVLHIRNVVVADVACLFFYDTVRKSTLSEDDLFYRPMRFIFRHSVVRSMPSSRAALPR